MKSNNTDNANQAVSSQASAANISSRADFVCFLRAFRKDLQQHPEAWENADLPAFLEAMAAWTEDLDGYYQNQGGAAPEQPTWKTMGEMLLAAKVYD